MEKLTLENLPEAVAIINGKVDAIFNLLEQINTTPPSEDADKPLSIREAADYVNLAVPTLYTLVNKRKIPYTKKGKRLYFSKMELKDWLWQGRKKTNSELEAEAVEGLRK